MIDPMSVAFDIDGVVADTVSLFIDIARDDFSVDGVQYEDITSYALEGIDGVSRDVTTAIIQKVLDGDYKRPLRPFPGAPEVLRRLGQNCGPVLFVTARPYLGPISKWIADNIGLESGAIDIIATGSFEGKADILLERNISFFIEDRLETCVLLNEAGITPVVFKQPWNRENQSFCEVNNWQELEALIQY